MLLDGIQIRGGMSWLVILGRNASFVLRRNRDDMLARSSPGIIYSVSGSQSDLINSFLGFHSFLLLLLLS